MPSYLCSLIEFVDESAIEKPELWLETQVIATNHTEVRKLSPGSLYLVIQSIYAKKNPRICSTIFETITFNMEFKQ